jgi:pimeloyl-ACP methyl ester carboxylesterase
MAMAVTYHTQTVGDVEVFYRQAGPVGAPVILLLHGFPTAGHMFRDLIPLLAGRYRVIAPDLPGFGNSKAPPRGKFDYTFDNLAKVVGGFIDAIGLDRYALYIFDYGAPTGLRIAMAHPERVTAIISQNGNAYLEGFSDAWGAWQTYWREPTPEHREARRSRPKPFANGNISTAPTAAASRPTATRSTSPIWRVRERTRSNSISCSTIAAMSRFTPPSKNTFATSSRHAWSPGARTTRTSFPPERKPIGAICRKPKFTSSMPGILRWRRMPRKSVG